VRVADRPEEAAAALAALPQVAEARVVQDTILVTLADGTTDGLIAETLVRAGFKLLALQPEEVKLDDAFMALTEGKVQ
jgi:hypothetical protein